MDKLYQAFISDEGCAKFLSCSALKTVVLRLRECLVSLERTENSEFDDAGANYQEQKMLAYEIMMDRRAANQLSPSELFSTAMEMAHQLRSKQLVEPSYSKSDEKDNGLELIYGAFLADPGVADLLSLTALEAVSVKVLRHLESLADTQDYDATFMTTTDLVDKMKEMRAMVLSLIRASPHAACGTIAGEVIDSEKVKDANNGKSLEAGNYKIVGGPDKYKITGGPDSRRAIGGPDNRKIIGGPDSRRAIGPDNDVVNGGAAGAMQVVDEPIGQKKRRDSELSLD